MLKKSNKSAPQVTEEELESIINGSCKYCINLEKKKIFLKKN